MTEQSAFHHIVRLLQQTIGLAPNCLSDRALIQVIRQRQATCGLPDLVAYWLYLCSSTPELTHLIEAIVVSETWFFRDYQPFVYLSDFIQQEWLLRHPHRRLRVLSLPCATGEEPYSIAITLLESGLPPSRWQIDAIDISQVALEKAKRSIYPQHSFREKRFTQRDRYFQPTAAGYQLSSEIRSQVNFKQANLLEPQTLTTFSHYDVIFCRNLLIYLDQSARTQAIGTLSQLLTEIGLLFVGHSELSLLTASEFMRVRQPFTFAVRKTQSSPKTLHQPEAKRSALLPTPRAVPPAIAPPSPPTVPTITALEQAKTLADQGQLQAAITLCQTHLNTAPTDAAALVLLGTLQQAIGQDQVSERSFQQALYLDPHQEEALLHLIFLKEKWKEQAQAEILRQRLQRLN
jgi:chemotaxis protein methyltransferase WspC